MRDVRSQNPIDTSFYDRAAASYDRLMATPSARCTRRSFQALVRANVEVPGPILDFGCGTGVDARHYAWLQYRVLAYDPSRAMLALLERRCVGAIRAGQVVPVAGDFEACLARGREWAPFGCIASNFGSMNHVEEPETVLACLSELLAPNGRIILSLLNPWYWRDVRAAWWWRSLIRSIGKPGLHVAVGENRTIRPNPARVGRQAGLKRIGMYGVNRRSLRDKVLGRMADPLVFIVLARR